MRDGKTTGMKIVRWERKTDTRGVLPLNDWTWKIQRSKLSRGFLDTGFDDQIEGGSNRVEYLAGIESSYGLQKRKYPGRSFLLKNLSFDVGQWSNSSP